MNWIIYSHTDYLDILKIQTHYLKEIDIKKLLINKTNNLPEELSKHYQEILFYDDNLPYASRILSLKDKILDVDYILLTHDIDIVLFKDDSLLNKLVNLARDNDIDRIDLQYYNDSDRIFNIEWNDITFGLCEQKNPYHFIYNVNPSIWKLSTLVDIMSNFSNENYRTIENLPTQIYSQKFKIYKLFSEDYVECGYFRCLPFYQFLHITHKGGLLPLRDNGLGEKLNNEYLKICTDFKFNTNRQFRISRW